jgi:hypothetical protein
MENYGTKPSFGSIGTTYGQEIVDQKFVVAHPAVEAAKSSINVIGRMPAVSGSNVATSSQHLNPSSHEQPSATDKRKPPTF